MGRWYTVELSTESRTMQFLFLNKLLTFYVTHPIPMKSCMRASKQFQLMCEVKQ